MEHTQRIAQAEAARAKLARQAAAGIWRQQYHFMAPGGWLNDPNGCIYHAGQYHLFYQHNPYAAVWGSMHWGHAASRDLVHWEHLPIALAPSEAYDDHSEGGVFSGSAVEVNGELAVLYTGTTRNGKEIVQTQCLATSRDGGLTFKKYAGNPVIAQRPEGISEDFRDPRVFCHEGKWYMVVGASIGAGARQGGEGCALLYHSADLKSWDYRGILLRSAGKLGSMWECPDLFPLGEKWVLTFSPMFAGYSTAVYLVGEMDFATGRFLPQAQGELDWGSDYYAPQSMKDAKGRTILMAWQNGWEWMPGWNGFGPTPGEGWCGGMALPRVVSLDAQNRVMLLPIPELEALRGELWEQQALVVGQQPVQLPAANPACFEMQLELPLGHTTTKFLHLYLRGNKMHRTRVTLDFEHKQLFLSRSQADEGHSHGVRSCPLLLEGKTLQLRVFSDISSLELFTDGGRTCMSCTYYPTHTPQEIWLEAEGGSVAIASVQIWELQDQGDVYVCQNRR